MFLKNNKKVLVAMSGGVDSSVAAFLLKKRGYEVVGAFIRGYNIDGCQDKEGEDARLVAEQIGIPFYVFNFEEEYKKRVVDYLLNGYRQGITPNPDVVCNSQIKFGLLYDKAMELGFDYVASGHYAQLGWEIQNPKFQITNWFKNRVVKIYEGRDEKKDQSYFLWQIQRDKFKKILFPIGNIKKEKVRNIALEANLLTASKKDSQGVCFLGKFKFDEFLKEHIKPQIGDIVDVNGKKVGEHDGVWFYTIGQKHGFKNTSGRSYYVVSKDFKNNKLVIAYEEDERLYCKEFEITNLNWLDDKYRDKFEAGKIFSIRVRTRYHQPLIRVRVVKRGDNKALVRLFKPMTVFPASGQSAVFYSFWGQMLGGGIIT
ncbi:MAG TPA: tRNA 2-thiouridine(34) synthase MnmA [Candidatus Paceibacterota bacterium]|nr:tRNA 2-thiouridine(34) synthase MnmA [Candidatus Paceibacterota bacterium]